jgi:hypothetical protein
MHSKPEWLENWLANAEDGQHVIDLVFENRILFFRFRRVGPVDPFCV